MTVSQWLTKGGCGARTPANTLPPKRSQECERGSHECARHAAYSTEPVLFGLPAKVAVPLLASLYFERY